MIVIGTAATSTSTTTTILTRTTTSTGTTSTIVRDRAAAEKAVDSDKAAADKVASGSTTHSIAAMRPTEIEGRPTSLAAEHVANNGPAPAIDRAVAPATLAAIGPAAVLALTGPVVVPALIGHLLDQGAALMLVALEAGDRGNRPIVLEAEEGGNRPVAEAAIELVIVRYRVAGNPAATAHLAAAAVADTAEDRPARAVAGEAEAWEAAE